MASTIFNRLSPQQAQPQTEADQINQLANQILGSVNPQETFNQLVNSNPDAKNAMNLINQYGNGDPKAAFMNYASAMGKQALGQQIMQRLNLT